MPFFNWSRTASSNGNADPTSPWPEGMAPSAVNDSARGLMAGLADWRDDMAGAIVTTGTNSAYLVSSFSGFDSTTHMDGQMIAFSPHVGNVDTVLLTVDGLGPFPLRASPSVELVSGTLILGTPYVALFNKTNGEFYLKGAGNGNPYNVPFLGGLHFWDTTAPNSRFIFPAGQAISRTVYSAAFARWGTTFGAGDGSTTFGVPDVRGRIVGALDNMGGTDAARLSNSASSMAAGRTTLGGAGGAVVETLTAAQIPSITSNGNNNITVTVTASGNNIPVTAGQIVNGASGTQNNVPESLSPFGQVSSLSGSTVNSISVTSNNTGSAAHDNMPPTILCNYIIRII